MKRFMIFGALILAGLFVTKVAANAYHLDHSKVDQMFASAEVVDFFDVEALAPMGSVNYGSEAYFVQDKDPLIAFLLSWFLGYLGIHRAYLGTSTGTVIGYILTLGGCGIVATIDWIVLLIGVINNDISQYVDNPKFFMW